MRVFVYFNLHKKLWSVKALEGENKGRVVLHTPELQLSDCTFKVSEAGRQRVLRERRKNVHAGVVGHMDTSLSNEISCSQVITYNPYKYSAFVAVPSLQPLTSAARVVFKGRTVTASLY